VREVQAGKLTLCVAKLNGKIFALDNECPHEGGPLGEGELEDGKVVCPWHGYGFDLNTGASDDNMRARVFEVTVEGEDVLAKV
jgi:nitrite reductase (NADH) small subunit